MDPSNNQVYTPLSLENITLGYALGPNTMLSSACLTPEGKTYRTESFSSPPVHSSRTPLNLSNSVSTSVVSSAMAYSSPRVPVTPGNDVALGSPYSRPSGLLPGARHSISTETSTSYDSKVSRNDKNNKGLRHFSMKVLQKVRERGITTYNEVADELVREFGSRVAGGDQSYDHKNIRRRVYDALNVLMAMNIIHKEKKEIKWVGLPTNSVQECQQLENRRNELINCIKDKLKTLRELVLEEISLKNLIGANQETEASLPNLCRMEMPFAVITTANCSTVDCSVTAQRDDYYFNFEAPYRIYSEAEVLRRLGYSGGLGIGECSAQSLEQCKAMLPVSLHPYIHAIAACTGEEFPSFILSHRSFLQFDQLTDGKFLPAESVFIAKLLESCQKKSRSVDTFQPSENNGLVDTRALFAQSL